MTQPIHILYVDDYQLDRELVRDALEREHGGFAVVEAKSRKDFEANLQAGGFDVVLSDFNILGFESLQVLEAVKEKYPEIPVIIVTGTGSEEVAVEAIKRGAADYIIKTPKHIQRLPHIIHDALEKKQLEIENQQMEETVTQTRELLTNLARLVPGVIYQYRLYPDGHSAFPYSSPGMNRIYEYSPEEVREDASPVFGRLHPDDYDMVSNAIFESARTLEEFYCEFRVILPRQGLRWRWSQAHPERMPDGSTLWHGIILDVTERKQAEEAVRESEEKFKYVFENSPIGKSFTKISGEIDVNQSFCEMLGYSKEELKNKNWRQITHPDDIDQSQKEVDAIQSGEKRTARFTKRYIKKDGTIVWADVRTTIRRDANGDPMYLVTAVVDITERVIAEEALRLSEKRFRTLFEHAPVGVALIESKTGRYLDINPQYCDFIGYTREEALHKSFQDVSHPGELKANLDQNAELVKGKVRSFALEKRFICKDGTIKWGFLTASPLWGENESPSQYIHIAVVQDISQNKKAEAEIRQLNLTLEKRVEERTRELRETQDKLVRHEKLAVLGQLAGGIGHELRNPLGVINNAVYFLKMTQPDANEKVKSYLSIIENEVKNGEKIIHDLISFTRGVTTNKEVVSLPDLLSNVLRRLPVSPAVSYQMDLAANCSSVRVDPFHLEQVMYNLLLNAFHAITQDDSGLAKKENKPGIVTIRTRKVKKLLEICVTDNGIGIPPENIQIIFEPLFTTKIKGMGLGLAISKKLIEANGGTIEASSVINEGSSFTVHLPTNC